MLMLSRLPLATRPTSVKLWSWMIQMTMCSCYLCSCWQQELLVRLRYPAARHVQKVNVLSQHSSIFTSCLSCVFLPWHFLLVHTPLEVMGRGALLPLHWYNPPSAGLSVLTKQGTEVKMFAIRCNCICVWVWTPCEPTMFPCSLCC